jgi:hypothetical protein
MFATEDLFVIGTLILLEGLLSGGGRIWLIASSAAPDYLEADELVGDRRTESRRELWPILLTGLVVVLMGEQLLAWWFGGMKVRSA